MTNFWEIDDLSKLSHDQWESLCDGCAKCCLNKTIDEDDNLSFTWSSCRLLNLNTCACKDYKNRTTLVMNCIKLTPLSLPEIAYSLPKTCAYRLLHEKKNLYPWHPLISGNKESVHLADISIKEKAMCELEIDEDHLDLFIVEDDEF